MVASQSSGALAPFRPRPRCPVPPRWPRPRARVDAEVADLPLLSVALLGGLGRGRRIPTGSMQRSRRPGAGVEPDLAIEAGPLDADLAIEGAPLTPTSSWLATAAGRARPGLRARRRHRSASMHDRRQAKERSADAELEERPRDGVRHLVRRGERKRRARGESNGGRRGGFQRPAGQEANHRGGSRRDPKVARNVARNPVDR